MANQNRGTLGGNLVNGSPAADSPPALLAYEAEVVLVSRRGGERRVPYSEFHTGYKQTVLAKDELVLAVVEVPRPRWTHWYLRKVGPRERAGDLEGGAGGGGAVRAGTVGGGSAGAGERGGGSVSVCGDGGGDGREDA